MNTKIVYVLVSRKSDYYVEMLRLSLASLRLYHPNDPVEIVMDDETYLFLTKKKSSLLQDAKAVVVNIPGKYSLTQRSRFLKTKLREFISGDFLFLDTDTVICGKLDDADLFDGDVCAVLDNHHGGPLEYQLGSYPDEWKFLAGSRQFNGGVLYAKDNPKAKRFFDQWFDYWDYSASLGCPFDQPALRKATSDSGWDITELSGIWNCQISRATSIEYQADAKIMHYQRSAYFVSYICKRIRRTGLKGKDIEHVLLSPKTAFKTNTLLLAEAESSAIAPLRYTLHNYPAFYCFLSNLAILHRLTTERLVRLKNRLLG